VLEGVAARRSHRPAPAPGTGGSSAGRTDERPAHRVSLGAFRLALLPVTNREYAAFLAATAHRPPRFWDDARFNAPDQPVVGVTWFDAVAYCDWLSQQTGRRWRLPTEAERERAARGGVEGRAYPWGDGPGEAGGRFEQDAPLEAGRSTPNGYGLLDIAHNIHEWCSDWYDARYYRRSPERDPQGPPSGTRRASRGGAWRHQVKVSRCAARSSLDPTFRYNDYGFRLATDGRD
jgi:formylglycine-generating enzyme required for sulfatase activity